MHVHTIHTMRSRVATEPIGSWEFTMTRPRSTGRHGDHAHATMVDCPMVSPSPVTNGCSVYGVVRREAWRRFSHQPYAKEASPLRRVSLVKRRAADPREFCYNLPPNLMLLLYMNQMKFKFQRGETSPTPELAIQSKRWRVPP